MRAFNKTLAATVGILAMIGFAGSANADLILLLDDTAIGAAGTQEVIIIDDKGSGIVSSPPGTYTSTAADGLIASPGLITYTGLAGAGSVWTVVVSGTSDPALPPNQLDIGAATGSSSAAGTLIFTLIDTDFNMAGDVSLAFGGGGATDGTVSFAYGGSGTNSDLIGSMTTTLLGPIAGTGVTGAFSVLDTTVDIFNTAGAYSLMIQWTFVHTGSAQSTTGDLKLVKIPEPATTALMGLALLGFGAARRRKQKAA